MKTATSTDGATTGAPGRSGWRHAAYLLASGSSQAAVAFASNLVLARHIAPEGFGDFALTLATLTLVYAFASLRPGALVIREGRRCGPERRAFLWNACLQESLFLGAASAVVLFVSGASAFAWSLWLSVWLAHFVAQARGFLERDQAYGALSLVESGTHVAAHGAAVVAALLGAGIWALPLREVLLGATRIGALALAGGLPRDRFAWLAPRDWRALAKDAKDLWSDGLLESLHARTIVLVAGWIGGVRGAGLFFQANRLAQVPHQFLQPVAGRLSFNWFARADSAAERDAQRRRLLLFLAAPLVAATAGCLFLADPLVPWLLGERWSEAAPLLASLALVAGGTSLLALAKMELLATSRLRALLGLRVAQFAGLAAVPLLLWFAPELGVRALGVGLGAGIVLALAVARIARRGRTGRARSEEPTGAGARRAA
ncbi:MAG: oligosaccharide flippase family protein [Planctomycetota bacterium]